MSVVRTKEEAAQAEDSRLAERRQELRDIRMVMSTVEGRRFMWRLLDESRFFLTTYSKEPLESYCRQGRRAVGLAFYADAQKACPELLWQAQKENISTEEKSDG